MWNPCAYSPCGTLQGGLGVGTSVAEGDWQVIVFEQRILIQDIPESEVDRSSATCSSGGVERPLRVSFSRVGWGSNLSPDALGFMPLTSELRECPESNCWLTDPRRLTANRYQSIRAVPKSRSLTEEKKKKEPTPQRC